MVGIKHLCWLSLVLILAGTGTARAEERPTDPYTGEVITWDIHGVGEEELAEFVDRAKKFFAEANQTQINVKECSFDGVKKLPQIEKAISDIASVLDETDPLTIIMAFSGDPVTVINPFIELIDNLENEVEKAKTQISSKLSLIGEDGAGGEDSGRYDAELKCILANKSKLEGMVNV